MTIILSSPDIASLSSVMICCTTVATFNMSFLGVKSKPMSHYDRRSVGQSIMLSSPIWSSRPDFCYCQLRSCRCGAPSLTGGRVCHFRGHSEQYMTSIFTSLLVRILYSHLPRVRFLVDTYYLVSYVTLVYMYVHYVKCFCQSRFGTVVRALTHVHS
jgi:hypothetical protein